MSGRTGSSAAWSDGAGAARPAPAEDPRHAAFYERSVHAIAAALLGCVVAHGRTAGRIVEVESYHQEEPACHAYAGLTRRTTVLFGPPGHAYVYRSYGIHALLNVVAEPEGVGAAVLIRALEPLEGLELMRARRGVTRTRELCSGPGKLTQALGIDLDLDGVPLTGGPIELRPRPSGSRAPVPVTGVRVGITKAAELPWRLCDATSDSVSRPLPEGMRLRGRAGAVAPGSGG